MYMNLDTYFNDLQGKQVLVLGLGVSNRPLVHLLLQYGIFVTGCDRTNREKLDEEILQFEARGLKLKLGESYMDDLQGDVVFRTPGIHPLHPSIVSLKNSGATITSEMEAFFAVCPCTMIAVTGSDGKTTTTTLIAEMLKQAGRTTWVGGNIGAPLLPRVAEMKPEDVAVVELSSFQLLHMTTSPHVAVMTNLAPNHLDVHKSMEEYVEAKEEIYLHQTAEDVFITNCDNDTTKEFFVKAKGKTMGFSRKIRPESGVYLEDGAVYATDGTEILKQSDIFLPGIHNVENYMAAICAVEGLVSKADIVHVAKHFGGVEHRIELVRVKDGVRYYNDSIASSPSRTLAGLRSFDQKIILIAGGYDKHIPYDVLGPEIVEHVKTLVLTGATAPLIKEAVLKAEGYAPGKLEILEIGEFYDSIRTASSVATDGDVVMLSPASASFDLFRNFMIRGQAFKKTVMEL
ncbi:MAG: UDP-N-acetylmuramoyl-L-alanine--D-glutamate ligase [Eubacteriales bacterium]